MAESLTYAELRRLATLTESLNTAASTIIEPQSAADAAKLTRHTSAYTAAPQASRAAHRRDPETRNHPRAGI